MAAVNNQPAVAVATLGKYTKSNDEASLKGAYDLLVRADPKVPTPKTEAIATSLQNSDDPAAKSADPRSFIDTSFVTELERDGFIAQLNTPQE